MKSFAIVLSRGRRDKVEMVEVNLTNVYSKHIQKCPNKTLQYNE
jgi:uncharacterized protein YqgQ